MKRSTFKPKPPKCKVCRQPFQAASTMQTVCRSRECIDAFALKTEKTAIARASKMASEQKRKDKAKLLDLQPLSYWEKRAEKQVNRYVRLRDYHKGCISCHLPWNWDGQWHASHFRSVGAASAVRFHLWNIHKACSVCNNKKSGNIENYRPRLISLISIEKVDWLMSQNQIARYSRDYLQRLERVFKKKADRQAQRLGIER